MKARLGLGLIVALLAVGGGVPAHAQDYTEGWIGLYDNESLFGWTRFGDAEWASVDGVLTCDGGSGGWLATTSTFKDYVLRAKVRVAAGSTAGLVYRANLQGHSSENRSGEITLTGTGEWQEVVVRARGAEVEVSIDGTSVEAGAGIRQQGYIGIQYHRAKVEVAEMKLRPLNLTPIFNGENLDGWNIIPDRKSVFTVVDGALNIKDGNGQIETDAQYKDFVLQMAIFSNGTHLNSGVFYRGPKGVFWRGYESQVRNQWEGDDRTKPVDYGTGGNYGNQSARKVVSNDKEWFYKTIVCDGNHTAVWINGYLVSDYLDARPRNEEGQGKEFYVPGPGTIHLQGHDPTTDLSFKDINLQEYQSQRGGGRRGGGAGNDRRRDQQRTLDQRTRQ